MSTTGLAAVPNPSPAPFEAFLSSLGAGCAANKAAAAAAVASAPPASTTTSCATPAPVTPPSPPAMSYTSTKMAAVVNAQSSTSDASSSPTSSPSLISSSAPGHPSSPSAAPPSSSGVTTAATAPERAAEGRPSSPPSSTMGTSPAATNSNPASSALQAASSSGPKSPAGTEQASTNTFDVTSSSGREALLLRFLQLLPSTHDLQQPLNQPPPSTATNGCSTNGGDEARACQQLVSEVVTALRLWVMQQPLTLGRPLGDDNPSLFALLRPQLRQLHWWRAPVTASSCSSTTPSHHPSSSPPATPLAEDLLALAWGNRAWQPPAAGVQLQKTEEGSSPTLSSPTLGAAATSPARGLSVPQVKVEQHDVNNGARHHHQSHGVVVPTVIGTIQVPGPMPMTAGPTNSNEGFEFNENDSSALAPAATAVLSKRRRSMDASLEVAGGGHMGRRQPGGAGARDQAMRKRRKSVIERTSTATAVDSSENGSRGEPARDLRKRKASLPSGLSAISDAAVDVLNEATSSGGLDDGNGSLSPKKIRFDDEDYIDSREANDREKEGPHRDVADSATPIRAPRGRGRGRGTRGMRTRGGRGGRASGGSAHGDKDLDGVPKTKARKPESCHRCKNKKEFWVGCPLVASHKYCRGCVVRHFSIDYDDFRANPEKYWTDGCPICHLTCPCIGCVRKKKNGQSGGGGGGAEDDRVDVEKDDDDEVGDPDEDEDEDGYGYDEEGDGGEEDDDEEVNVDVDNNDDNDDEDDMSEEKSAESLIEVRWSALKRQLDVKDAAGAGAASDSVDNDNAGHLPVKKRMSRMRSNSFASGNGPSSRGGPSSAYSSSASSAAFLLDDAYPPQQTHHQPPRKRATRARSYSTSHCEQPKQSAAAMNPEDYLGRTGAGSVLAARYSSPMRRGSRGNNARGGY